MPKPNQAVIRVELRGLTHDDWKELSTIANTEGRSFANLLCQILKEYLAEQSSNNTSKDPDNNQNSQSSSNQNVANTILAHNMSKPVNSMPKPVSPKDSGDKLEPGNLWDNDGVQYHPIPRSDFERKTPEFQSDYLECGRKVID